MVNSPLKKVTRVWSVYIIMQGTSGYFGRVYIYIYIVLDPVWGAIS